MYMFGKTVMCSVLCSLIESFFCVFFLPSKASPILSYVETGIKRLDDVRRETLICMCSMFECMRKGLLAAAFLLMVSAAVAQSTIGAAPGYRDLGTIERGESRDVTFYITSDASETFELQAGFQEPLYSRVFSGGEIENQYSREPIDSWVNFDQDSYVIDPNDTTTVRLENGAPVSSQGEVTFNIRVPRDAEPGYRVGGVSLSPESTDSGSVVGASNMGIVRPSFAFRVPGEVTRDIELTNLRALRIGDNSAQIIAEFRNTGTVTTRMDSDTLPIVNQASQKVGEIDLGSQTIAPGQYAQLDAVWSGENVDGGEYSIEGTVNYMTGNAYVGESTGSFVLTDQIQERVEVEETSPDGSGQDSEISMFLVLLFLVFLGVLLYSFDIDPFWIVIGVCATGMVLLVLSTSIPNWLIPVLLIGVGGLVYYV